MGAARWWICALLLAATTINYLDRVALNQSASAIQAAFGIKNLEYSLLESGFQLAFAAGALLFGFLVDRYGLRWTYTLSVLGWSLAGFLTGFTQGYGMLLACRITLGFFEAGNWPCGIRTVRTVLAPAERPLGNAFFQSGTGLGAMLTPLIIVGCLAFGERAGIEQPWRLPFLVIGLIGLGWIALWWLTVPARWLQQPMVAQSSGPGATADPNELSFLAILQDRRFLLLIVLIIGVNTTWHTYRVWLPLFLERQLGIPQGELPWWNFAYYAVADVGSWLAGGTVLVLVRWGWQVGRARWRVFTAGVALLLPGFLLPWYTELGRAITLGIILLSGFGALGLFATYFALSQDISPKHQGKITGTLGAINSLFLASLYPIQGSLGDSLGGYDRVLGAAAVPACLAFVLVGWAWPRSPAMSSSVQQPAASS